MSDWEQPSKYSNSSFQVFLKCTALLEARTIAHASVYESYRWNSYSCKQRSTKNSAYFLTYWTIFREGNSVLLDLNSKLVKAVSDLC